MIDVQLVPSNLNPNAHCCTISIVSKTRFSLVRWAPEENYPKGMEDVTATEKIKIRKNGTYTVELVAMDQTYLVRFSVCHLNTPKLYAGGTGIQEDPYLIDSCAQFNSIRLNLSAHYRLISDLDFGYEMGNLCWLPIGSFKVTEPKIISTISLEDQDLGYQFEYGFQGSLDGNGHAISGIHCKHPVKKDLGIFGACGPKAHIFDLLLNNCVFDSGGSTECVGSLAGRTEGTKVERCTVSNIQVSASGAGGGIIGDATRGTYINFCHFHGRISGAGIYGPYSRLGGIAGMVEGVSPDETCDPRVRIENCSVQATIGNCMYGGGIATGSGVVIKKCIFRGAVSAQIYADAIVPDGECEIEACEQDKGTFEITEKGPKISG